MHDGISVLKHGLEEPELIAEKLSEVVSEALGYKMVVHHEVMEPEQLQNMCAYSRTDVVSNHQFEYETKEEFEATLDALATQLSRYFVCMTKMETDAVVELEYSPGSDRINKHIIRTSAKTMQTHPGTLIVTQVERVEATDKDDKPILGPDKKPVFVYKPKKSEPLLSWYIRDARRREKHRIGVYFTEAEERKHPNDLNVSAGLPFDERFENEPPQERTAFVDPFDEEPDWKTLDGLDFLLWHVKVQPTRRRRGGVCLHYSVARLLAPVPDQAGRLDPLHGRSGDGEDGRFRVQRERSGRPHAHLWRLRNGLQQY